MQRSKRKSLGLLAVLAGGAAAAALLGGCFDVEQSVSLGRDLSGTASFRMTVDLEPMIVLMAGMQHAMSGKEGDPTPQEVAEARRSFLDKRKGEDPAKSKQEVAEQKEKLAKTLPPGVKLLAGDVDEQGTRIVARFQFGFDDVRKLAQIKLPEKGGEGQPGKNPYEDPFSTMKVVDEGSTLLVTIGGGNPAARLQDQAAKGGGGPDASPEMAKAFESAFKNARFAFRLDTPFEVVETNATRRDGRALVWELRATDPPDKMPVTLTARFKK